MTYRPPIKSNGKSRKKETPLPVVDFKSDLNLILNTVADAKETVQEVIRKSDDKIGEMKQTMHSVERRTTEAINTIGDVKEQAVEYIKSIQAKDGRDGKDADPIDEEKIINSILEKIPPQPIFDEDALIIRTLKALPENKASLKIIQEKIEIDPQSILEKLLASDKFKIKSTQIEGLEDRVKEFWARYPRGYLHGGGDTVTAGTGITITTNANGQKVISASGSAIGVSSINGLTGAIVLAAGSNITLTPVGNTITIASSGGGGGVTSVSGTANRITSTGGATPVIDISASYIGQASITTLGTVTTGTWNATAVTVPYGGTGNTTFTAYSVITAGTTATGTFQNVSGLGTSGQVLTSNGAGALPSWQTATGGVPTQITVANEATDTTCFLLFVTAATGDLGPKTNAAFKVDSQNERLDVTLIRADVLTARVSVTSDVDNVATVGGPAKQFAGVYLGTGAFINFNGSDSLITHSAGILTLNPGDFRVTTAGTNTASVVTVGGTQTLAAKTLTAPKFADAGFIADASGNELIIFTTTASAVNEWTLANGATGVNPKLTASGETNVGLDFLAKGTGTFRFLGNSTQAAELRLYEDTDNGTNYSAFKVGTQASDITYTLPTAVGGANTFLKDVAGNGVLSWAAFSGLTNPMTTTGDIIYSSDGSGTPARLAIGGAGKALYGGTTPSYKFTNLTLFDHYADVSNVNAGETDLYSDTIAANQIAADGDKIFAYYTVNTFNSINFKTVKFYFAGTLRATAGTITGTSTMTVDVMIIRSSSSTARAVITIMDSGLGTPITAAEVDMTSLDFTGTNVIKITGTGGASTEITAKLGSVIFQPAA